MENSDAPRKCNSFCCFGNLSLCLSRLMILVSIFMIVIPTTFKQTFGSHISFMWTNEFYKLSLATGCLLMILSVFGTILLQCTANTVMINIYSLFLFLHGLFQFSIVYLSYNLFYQSYDIVLTALSPLLNEYNQYTDEMNWMQSKFACCGIHSYLEYSDWNTTSAYIIYLPLSCCEGYTNGLPANTCDNTSNSLSSGCLESVFNVFTYDLSLIGFFSLFIGLAEMSAVVFNILLVRTIHLRNDNVK